LHSFTKPLARINLKGRKLMRRKLTLLVLPLGLLLAACDASGPSQLSGGTDDDGSPSGANGSTGSGSQSTGASMGSGGGEPEHTALDDRATDYMEAYRTASLKLVRALPTLQQIKDLAAAKDQKKAYATAVDELLADTRFNARMVKFWRDAMKMGGDAEMDAAPVLAAKIMVEEQPFMNLFTAASGTCPTFDGATGAFTDGDCQNGVTTHAGVLTNPGVMKQFYSNMAFRRVRWVQETFVCTKFPAEVVSKPSQVDGKDFTSPWDFNSISGAPINFLDTQSVVCANCHTTLNHLAPLFGNFDMNGALQGQISVETPQAPDPIATERTHWIAASEKTAWRHGEEVADLPALGKAIAADPDVAECAVARMWNFAMSKEDIVNDLAIVPDVVLDSYKKLFNSNDMDLKATLRAMLLSDDFTKF
jgi:hypothetical protein